MQPTNSHERNPSERPTEESRTSFIKATLLISTLGLVLGLAAGLGTEIWTSTPAPSSKKTTSLKEASHLFLQSVDRASKDYRKRGLKVQRSFRRNQGVIPSYRGPSAPFLDTKRFFLTKGLLLYWTEIEVDYGQIKKVIASGIRREVAPKRNQIETAFFNRVRDIVQARSPLRLNRSLFNAGEEVADITQSRSLAIMSLHSFQNLEENNRLVFILFDFDEIASKFKTLNREFETQGRQIYLLNNESEIILGSSQKAPILSNAFKSNYQKFLRKRVASEQQNYSLFTKEEGDTEREFEITLYKEVRTNIALASFKRLPSLPPPQQDSQSESGFFQDFFGQMIATVGFLLFLFGLYRMHLNRKSKIVEIKAAYHTGRTGHAGSPLHPAHAPSSPVGEAITLLEKVRTRKGALDIVSQFEKNVRRLPDQKLVASMLAESASHLCDSPTLFLRYIPSDRAAELETDAGFENGKSPEKFLLKFTGIALNEISLCVRQGKVASLSKYPPLAQLLLDKLGIACHEAWAITSASTNKSTSTLVGVLVILHSGTQSTTHRDALFRLMKAAAIVHDQIWNDKRQRPQRNASLHPTHFSHKP